MCLLSSKQSPPFQLTIRKSNKPSPVNGCSPNTKVVVSKLAANQYRDAWSEWDPNSQSLIESTPTDSENYEVIGESIPTYGIVGTFNVGGQLWLCLLDQVAIAGHILNHTIYTPKVIRYVLLGDLVHAPMLSVLDAQELDTYKDMFESGGFYFSYTYALWHHLQYISFNPPASVPSPQETERRRRYIWNSHINGNLPGAEDTFLVNLVRGHVETSPLAQGLTMTIISRIDRNRAGTRFSVRGLNTLGEAAISVESEVIIFSKDLVASHLQLRGSLPLLWSQETTKLAYKPPVIVYDADEEATNLAVLRHFDAIQKWVLPGPTEVLNLLRTSGDEDLLATAIEDRLSRLNIPQVNYHPIPLLWGSQSLDELLVRITDPLLEHGYFVGQRNQISGDVSAVLRRQTGLFRINCMDCMDRTSIAQFGLIRQILPDLMASVSQFVPDAIFTLRQAWANMANAVASYSTGTGIVNEVIIRDGSRTQGYNWKDQMVCGARYFLNNTHDHAKNFWLLRFLGLHPGPTTSPFPQPTVAAEHMQRWRSILGAPPLYSSTSISTSYIESLEKEKLDFVNSQFLSNLLKIGLLSEYCLVNNLDSDQVLRQIP
ncbi:Phosphatidylinositide phosphatase SAC1 [Entomophthora muscae]|uniref:Phosphatidylinositide phosphatase SAC1 n=2 Tax=Entomophthora muscae TaxID=34485 RepID=A0ACC2REF9_9FUNG|nr:Phosphatidylinositide phosphatase SAC1 [Entomophthora muscae]